MALLLQLLYVSVTGADITASAAPDVYSLEETVYIAASVLYICMAALIEAEDLPGSGSGSLRIEHVTVT